jgi:hypothetical protein
MDKTTQALVDALKEAMAHLDAQPLYKSGKQPGLFPGRGGVFAEAAQVALRDGLLEIVRSEAKGKGDTDFARITPRGVQFVYEQESPKAVLEELATLLRPGRDGLPHWAEELRAQLQAAINRFGELLDRQGRQLEQLNRRAEAALRRLAAGAGPGPLEPWLLDALDYLDRRKVTAPPGDCPLPELFRFLRERHAALSVAAFHDGLRRLGDRGAVALIPYPRHLSQLDEPEFALLDGASVYYAARRG